MFGRRATARERNGRGHAPGVGRATCAADGVMGVVVGMAMAAGCGAPNPRIFDATEEARGLPSAQLGNERTEQDKINALIAAVRSSEHVFVHDDIERGGGATADKLQLLLERDPTGVRSAREFIERIAAPRRTDEPPDRVRLSEDESVLAEHWYHARLAELEGRPAPAADPEQAREAEEHARRLRILDALAIVERSELRFVSPARKTLPKPTAGKPTAGTKRRPRSGPTSGLKPKPMMGRKPKRKEYTGPQFSEMLRKKWEFLGADIRDLDTFIDEIASDSFASMVRYRVILGDGREEDFGTWLRAQLDAQRAAKRTAGASTFARGGAP